MSRVMDVVAETTNGKSFNTYRFSYDRVGLPAIDYDTEEKQIRWKVSGETQKHLKPVHLEDLANAMAGQPSILRYFLDGSRHVYKVDDIQYGRQVYPVIAGQIGVGCCYRDDTRHMQHRFFDSKLVLSLPEKGNPHGWDDGAFLSSLVEDINKKAHLPNGIVFSDALFYSTQNAGSPKVNLEDRAIACVQDCMIEAEKDMVHRLTKEGLLNQDNYLIKDGSLEYKVMGTHGNDARTLSKLKQNYRWVIGVSKSFNPESCRDASDKPNSDFIASLPVYCRTPVARYTNDMVGDVEFAVWYVRLRDKRKTLTPFDGVLKVEKLLVTAEEIEDGIDSDEADAISAFLINERNPTCYGKDQRWANHIYPVYLTESYVKSKYMSSELFLSLF